jgi:hypothetical protein
MAGVCLVARLSGRDSQACYVWGQKYNSKNTFGRQLKIAAPTSGQGNRRGMVGHRMAELPGRRSPWS